MPFTISAAGLAGKALLRSQDALDYEADNDNFLDGFMERREAGIVALTQANDVLVRVNPDRLRGDGIALRQRALADAEVDAIFADIKRTTAPHVEARKVAREGMDRPVEISDVKAWRGTRDRIVAGEVIKLSAIEVDAFLANDASSRLREIRDRLFASDGTAALNLLREASRAGDAETALAIERISPLVRSMLAQHLGIPVGGLDELRRDFLRAIDSKRFSSYDAIDECLSALCTDARHAVESVDRVVGSPNRMALAKLDQLLAPIAGVRLPQATLEV